MEHSATRAPRLTVARVEGPGAQVGQCVAERGEGRSECRDLVSYVGERVQAAQQTRRARLLCHSVRLHKRQPASRGHGQRGGARPNRILASPLRNVWYDGEQRAQQRHQCIHAPRSRFAAGREVFVALVLVRRERGQQLTRLEAAQRGHVSIAAPADLLRAELTGDRRRGHVGFRRVDLARFQRVAQQVGGKAIVEPGQPAFERASEPGTDEGNTA